MIPDDTFEKQLVELVLIARKEYEYFQKRNQGDEGGGIIADGYSDEDWSSMFASQARLEAYLTVLEAYVQFKTNRRTQGS